MAGCILPAEHNAADLDTVVQQLKVRTSAFYVVSLPESDSDSAEVTARRLSGADDTAGEQSLIRVLSDANVAAAGELAALHLYYAVDLLGSTAIEFSQQLDALSATIAKDPVWQLDSGAGVSTAISQRIFMGERDMDDLQVSSTLSDVHSLVQRRKSQKKLGSASSASASSASAVITGAIAPLPLPEYAIEMTLLQRSAPLSVEEPVCTPTLAYTRCNVRTMRASFSVLHYTPARTALADATSQLLESLVEQVTRASQQVLRDPLPAGLSATLRARHFQPPQLSHAVTTLDYTDSETPADVFKGDTAGFFSMPSEDETHPSLCQSPSEVSLRAQRARLHAAWSLPTDRPLFRDANALAFVSAGPSPSNPSQYILQPRLFDVHTSLLTSGTGGAVFAVSGPYAYYHYMQDRLNDNGWGCAYRTLQTLCSWFVLAGYTRGRPIPTHRDIQTILVTLGDKEARFIGSSDWIGSTEVGLVLDYAYGVVTKTLFVAAGNEVDSHARVFRNHFRTQGTPIMIGGGVLAYGLIGIDYNEATGEVRYLILDPHYTGGDSLPIILKGGWCGWKKSDLFLDDHFYNFAMPQRPKDAI